MYVISYICSSLSHFTHYDNLWFHPCPCEGQYFLLFHDLVILHCIYVHIFFYRFLCWWTFRLLPCPGYCKQCCSEHWVTCVSFWILFSFRLLPNIEQSSPYYTGGPRWLSILIIVVCTRQSQTPNYSSVCPFHLW